MSSRHATSARRSRPSTHHREQLDDGGGRPRREMRPTRRRQPSRRERARPPRFAFGACFFSHSHHQHELHDPVGLLISARRSSQSGERSETHSTGPIRTGQDTLREGAVESTRRKREHRPPHNTRAHKHRHTPRQRLLLLHHRGDAEGAGTGATRPSEDVPAMVRSPRAHARCASRSCHSCSTPGCPHLWSGACGTRR